MNFVEDILLSKWQYIAVFFSFIALMAMILGKYPLKTTIKSTIMAVLVNFVVVSYFIYLNLPEESEEVSSNSANHDGITEEEQKKKEKRAKELEQNIQDDIEKQLELVYESNKDLGTNKELVVYAQPFYNGDKLTTYLYAKNFHTEWEFNGRVRVATYNDADEVVHDELLEVQLKPGETKLVHREFGDPGFEWFRYEFYPGEQ